MQGVDSRRLINAHFLRHHRVYVRCRFLTEIVLASVHWRCWLGGRKGIRPVKNWVVGAGVVIGLDRGADLHMAQLMPLPVTVSCFSKSRLVLPFWYRLTRVVLEKGPLNGCVCAYVPFFNCWCSLQHYFHPWPCVSLCPLQVWWSYMSLLRRLSDAFFTHNSVLPITPHHITPLFWVKFYLTWCPQILLLLNC